MQTSSAAGPAGTVSGARRGGHVGGSKSGLKGPARAFTRGRLALDTTPSRNTVIADATPYYAYSTGNSCQNAL